ncbi:hypothetical protein ACFFON_15295 [Arthrobacter citreus]|uniref:hypothetical protein n=1 Tax=Arthrobacter TaxID=1663 RepID=UPI00126577E5|nr:hypothetical protein [Arthrobacter gandavensis]
MNKHHKDAAENLTLVDFADDYREERLQILMAAQTEATLAVAFEQRTANLIAALGQVGPQDAIARQIEERLNLA